MNFGFLPSAKLSPSQERLWNVLSFLVRVSVLSLPLYFIIWTGADLYPLRYAAASQAAWLLQAIGYQLTQQGSGIALSNGFRFFIIDDCTGWKSMLFLFALVFAVKGISLRKRAPALLVGIPLIWVANLFRITGVVYAQGLWGTETALYMHDTLFQLGLIAVVLSIWMFWLLRIKNPKLFRPFSRILARLK